uniref:Uncharacterized protein n=1 Tax=Arcella intermedia TaxID=1963864 RepID=A0A6B2L1N4_9EUKA
MKSSLFDREELQKGPLFSICKKGDIRLLKALVRVLGRLPASYETSLLVACEYGHQEVVSFLIHNDADPSLQENYPLVLSCDKGHAQVVTTLLAHPKVSPSAQNNFPIALACANGHVEVVKLLLQFRESGVDPGSPNNFGLCHAAENGHIQIVRLLLTVPSVDPAARDNAPLCLAAENGHVEILRLLMECERVDPAAQNNYALRTACSKGNAEIVRLLLLHPEVDPGADNDEPLCVACKEGHFEIVRLLLTYCHTELDSSPPSSSPPSSPPSSPHFSFLQIPDKHQTANKQIIHSPLPSLPSSPLASSPLASSPYFISHHGRRISNSIPSPSPSPHFSSMSPISTSLPLPSLHSYKSQNPTIHKPRTVNPAARQNYPLLYACSSGHAEIVRLLLQFPSVDPSIKDYLPLCKACVKGHLNVVKVLVGEEMEEKKDWDVKKSGKDNGRVRRTSYTPTTRHKSRVDLAAKDHYPLRSACTFGHVGLVKFLMENLHVNDKVLNGCIKIAKEKGHNQVVELLSKRTKGKF